MGINEIFKNFKQNLLKSEIENHPLYANNLIISETNLKAISN